MAVATPGAAPWPTAPRDALQRAEHLGCVGERHTAFSAREPVRSPFALRRDGMNDSTTHAVLALVVFASLVAILAMTHTPIPEALSAAITALVGAMAARLTPSPTR